MDTFDRIEQLLIEKGWNKSELLRRMSLSTSAFRDWRHGKSSLDKHLPRIAELLETTVAYLKGDSSLAHPPKIENAIPIEHVKALLGKKPIPILGTIKAGLPILAEENYEGIIDVGFLDGDFVLRVSGDSMVYAGIHDGDLVVIKAQESAHPGQIVAATKSDGFSDQEATLKYLIKENGSHTLRAANPEYTDQPFTDQHRVIGVFVGLIRDDYPSMTAVRDLATRRDLLSDSWASIVLEATAHGLGPKDFEGVIDMVKKFKM